MLELLKLCNAHPWFAPHLALVQLVISCVDNFYHQVMDSIGQLILLHLYRTRELQKRILRGRRSNSLTQDVLREINHHYTDCIHGQEFWTRLTTTEEVERETKDIRLGNKQRNSHCEPEHMQEQIKNMNIELINCLFVFLFLPLDAIRNR